MNNSKLHGDVKPVIADAALLSNSLSGFAAGGAPCAWLAGMVIVEGCRVLQNLTASHSIALRIYIINLIALSVTTVM